MKKILAVMSLFFLLTSIVSAQQSSQAGQTEPPAISPLGEELSSFQEFTQWTEKEARELQRQVTILWVKTVDGTVTTTDLKRYRNQRKKSRLLEAVVAMRASGDKCERFLKNEKNATTEERRLYELLVETAKILTAQAGNLLDLEGDTVDIARTVLYVRSRIRVTHRRAARKTTAELMESPAEFLYF